MAGSFLAPRKRKKQKAKDKTKKRGQRATQATSTTLTFCFIIIMAFVVGGPKKKLAPRSSKSSKETFFAPEKDPFQNLLSLYTNAPTGEMTLEEFENAAVDRMTVLKEIDTVSRQPGGLNNPVYLEKIKDALSQYLPLISHGTARQETIRKDVLSHYALRLAFSHSGDKEWWIKQEQSLLSLRLQFLYSADLVEILNSSGLHYPQLSLVCSSPFFLLFS